MSIRVDLKIFAFALLLLLSGQSTTYILLFAFAVIHEMGHLICGLLLGLKPVDIKFMPVGLSILFDKTKEKWWKELLVSASGPIINFIIAIVFLFLNSINKRDTIIYANLLIGLFNLLPIIPLDGGRILKSMLKKFYEEREAEEYVHKLSNIAVIILTGLSSIGTFYLKNIAVPAIMVYIWAITIKENKRYKIKKRIDGIISQN